MAEEQPQPAFNERTAAPLGDSMSLDGDREKLAAYYASWAPTYDDDVGGDAYGLPSSVVRVIDAVAARLPGTVDLAAPVLDAGCGTGRVGFALAERGFTTIDGIDLSPEMVDRARARGVYRRLEAPVDLTQPPPSRWAQMSPLVVVGGVFTVGHVPPTALHAVKNLVQPGGVLVTSVRPGYYDTTDYQAVSAALIATGAMELVVEFNDLPYTPDTNGRFFAYRIST